MNNKPADPLFDGHLEHPLQEMNPREKLEYLWLQTRFRDWAQNRAHKVNNSSNRPSNREKQNDRHKS